jgi:multiple sugar transport system substrate-binding protein
MRYGKVSSVALIALTSITGVTACGNSNGTGSSKGGPVTVTFWDPWSAASAGAINAVVKEFNATHKDVQVVAVGNQTTQKQTIALAGGTPPDVILTDSTNILPWAMQGAAEPLTSYMQKDNLSAGQFIPSTMKPMEYKNQVYALPYSVGIESALLYNKKDFQAAGISSPPTTLSELYTDAQKLTTKSSNGQINHIGFIPDFPWFDPVFWPLVFGGKFYDASTNQITPDDPANIQALNYEKKFYDLYGVNELNKLKSGFGKLGTPDDPLVTGQLAMEAGWDYTDAQYRGSGQPIGVATFPYPDGHPELKGAGLIGPDAIFIPAKAKNKQAAWEFMDWMVGEKAQVLFAEQGNSIPSVTADLTDKTLLDNPNSKVMLPFYQMATSPNLGSFPSSSYSAKYAQAMVDEGQKVLLGQESAAAAMANVKEQIEPLVQSSSH